MQFRMQVSPMDCTGCGNCVERLPGQGKGAGDEAAVSSQDAQEENWEFAQTLPEFDCSAQQARP